MTSIVLRQRRSIRLPDYDHSQEGAYFITICTHQRALLFQVPEYRQIIIDAWQDLPNHYPHVTLDVFVTMPNHVHGIIFLEPEIVGAGFKPAPTTSTKHHGLPEILRAFKTFSARRINALRGTSGVPVWQRNYYEHVIRTQKDMGTIREYVINNPLKWEEDPENPDFITSLKDIHHGKL